MLGFRKSDHIISSNENSTHTWLLGKYNYRNLPESDSIKAYLERVTLYFKVNHVADSKKVPMVLSLIKAPTYVVLSNLLAPEKPCNHFDKILMVSYNHFEPK